LEDDPNPDQRNSAVSGALEGAFDLFNQLWLCKNTLATDAITKQKPDSITKSMDGN
jgi:hypothetical protein